MSTKIKPLQLVLGKAITLAATYHADQFDKGGHPYILHPLAVMERMPKGNLKSRILAVLHDVVEDAKDSKKALADVTEIFAELPLQVAEELLYSLSLLTHGNITYGAYIEAVSEDEIATLVKLGDLEENSDITRLKGISEKDLARMAKYHKAYTNLKKAKISHEMSHNL